MSTVLFEVKDSVGILTLNNPPQNRMGGEMNMDMGIALQTVLKQGAKVIVIRAEGDIFSYGGDFTQWIGKEPAFLEEFMKNSVAAINMIESLPVPVIAAVNGPCWGGAFEIALMADLIYACPEATFNHPEQSIAIPTLLGGCYRFANRAGMNAAKELAFTAEAMDAKRMYELGVVNKVFAKADLDEEVMKVASKLAKGSAPAFAATKNLMRAWAKDGIQAADDILIEESMKCFNAPDSKHAFKIAKEALDQGKARPVIDFREVK